MNRILDFLGNHKADIGIYWPSVAATLSSPKEKTELVTSLSQVAFLHTSLSVSVIVEIGAAAGVGAMLISYSCKFYKFAAPHFCRVSVWLKAKRNG